MLLKISRQLLDQAGGGDGAAGGGANGAGTAGAAGGAGQNTGGNNGAGGSAGDAGASGDGLFDGESSGGNSAAGSNGNKDGQGQSGGQSGQGAGAAGNVGQDWKNSLPDDLKNDAFLSKYPDLPAAMRGFKEAQKMIGADKIPVPPKGTPVAQMKDLFAKLGQPQDVADYKFDLANPKGIDEKFLGEFKQMAHSANVLPEQAKALLDFMVKTNEELYNAGVQAQEKSIAEGLSGLKKEWGDAYKQELGKAKAAMKEFLSEDEQKVLRDRGYGRDPLIIKLLSKIGGTLGEDKIRGEGGGTGALTVMQARAKIDEIKADIKGPYYNKAHPEHEKIKKEVSGYYALAFPGPNQNPIARKDAEL
jgi:hypothetical protein